MFDCLLLIGGDGCGLGFGVILYLYIVFCWVFFMSVFLFLCGCGIVSNFFNCFVLIYSEVFDDGWEQDVLLIQFIEVCEEIVCMVIFCNQLLDFFFDCLINFYCGCEYGCIYCYVWFSYVYWDFLLGIDFEIWLIVKSNVVSVLEQELSKFGYCCVLINLGVNIDFYQLLECECCLICQVLEVLLCFCYLLIIVIKGLLIFCDFDLLCELVEQNLVVVMISLIIFDDELKCIFELCVVVFLV